MAKIKECHLEEVLAACEGLGAELRYHPAERYFTAMVWSRWGQPDDERAALAIQRKIQRKAGQFSNVVCYCFDAFSTLVYEI